jgi:hypothetical protein
VPTLRLEADEEIVGVISFFGEDRGRSVVRLVIRGEDIGYLERREVLKLLRPRVLGYGDSDHAGLPGVLNPESLRLYEVECPVTGCPDSPIYVVRYDERHPPHCRVHTDHELSLKS